MEECGMKKKPGRADEKVPLSPAVTTGFGVVP
jgi:hypothetical protein